MKQKINPEGVAKPPAPYSSVIKVDAPEMMIFLSGVSGTDENLAVTAPGDMLEQTKQIIRNVTVSLEAAGARPEDVVMTTTYVLSGHMEDFLTTGASTELFSAFDHPADTLVGVASLAGMKYGAVIEVSVIAVKN